MDPTPFDLRHDARGGKGGGPTVDERKAASAVEGRDPCRPQGVMRRFLGRVITKFECRLYIVLLYMHTNTCALKMSKRPII
jgi:hypothetical protein